MTVEILLKKCRKCGSTSKADYFEMFDSQGPKTWFSGYICSECARIAKETGILKIS